MCACLPSTNILYERLRRGDPLPKTGRIPDPVGDYQKRSDNSSYWWSVMTKGQTKAARTEVATVVEPVRSPHNPATFDTELAVLAGQPMGMRPPTAEHDSISVHFDEEWTYNPRANSIDGRREGWLASDGESSSQADASAAAARSVAWQHHELEARKSWEAVWERAIPAEGLSPVPEDPRRSPPRLKLTTHPLPDWEDLEQK